MPKNKLRILSFVFLILTLTACNLPGGQNLGVPELALTITAQALLLQPGTPLPPLNTPLPDSTSTPEFTPTPSIPTVTVSQDTNCRTGPGVQYDLIGALLIGQSAEVVGKNTESNYWIIKTPGGSGTCWLWGQYATVSGNTSGLLEYAIPATPTPSATATLALPAPVKDLTAAKVCILIGMPNFQYTGSIIWKDKSDNETGFHIYFNGGLFGTVGPNVTSYPIPPMVFPAGTPMTMGVDAFNAAGKSIMKTVVITCP